ncbi:hypothetical protein TorRG33x02_199030 [Trema orientale]|uniref:G-protein coupled receptors family 2 profile 2 domain-containing protein n=1 Tax=Trema orientale TaxID=63057 RepID=A0A2P5EFN4_TREOI|nr:hypothetical protein TorRG33x02_199030 [Trema orientale]
MFSNSSSLSSTTKISDKKYFQTPSSSVSQSLAPFIPPTLVCSFLCFVGCLSLPFSCRAAQPGHRPPPSQSNPPPGPPRISGYALQLLQHGWGYNTHFFCVTSFLWTTTIAFTLHRTAVRHKTDVQDLEAIFHLYVWGTSLLMTVIRSFGNNHGHLGAWCSTQTSTRKASA